MINQILHFARLSDHDRKTAAPLPKLVAGDRQELHVRDAGGKKRTLPIPPSAASAVEALLAHMLRGERVAVLAEDQELSPKRNFSHSRHLSSARCLAHGPW